MNDESYCVMGVHSGRIEYLGRSLTAAATALEPGTVYGKGGTKATAYVIALEHRDAELSRSSKETGVGERHST